MSMSSGFSRRDKEFSGFPVGRIGGPKTLIYSGVFCQTEESVETVKLWYQLTKHLNPDCDIIIMDSCSPFDPRNFLPADAKIYRFDTNPGHLSQGGRDGAGRTFCEGLVEAAKAGYDYAVHLESDMFLARPIAPLIDKMDRCGVGAAACFLPQYQFFEFGIFACNVRRMVATDFVKRYDWENAPKWPIPERRLIDLLQDDLFLIPWFGTRNDQGQINPYTFHLSFPYQTPDFITHCTLDVAHKFIQLNEIELP